MEVRDLVDAHVYESESDAIRDAVRHLLRARPDARIQVAVHRFQTEGLSLARAAALAGLSWSQMKDVLIEKGVDPRLGPETVEVARDEVRALREHLDIRA
jgi:predicted HTH domain antitoxin